MLGNGRDEGLFQETTAVRLAAVSPHHTHCYREKGEGSRERGERDRKKEFMENDITLIISFNQTHHLKYKGELRLKAINRTSPLPGESTKRYDNLLIQLATH